MTLASEGNHRLDVASSTATYEGWTIRKGVATSAASWKIKKITTASDQLTIEQWADGNGLYDNIWDNRVSLSYS